MKKLYISTLQLCIVALLLIAANSAFAFGDPWTTVGSTGTVDEIDQSEVQFTSGIAMIRASAPSASTVTLRYNITSTADLNDNGFNKVMGVRFRDNGTNARVLLYVKGYNINNGSQVTLMSFDSDNYAASNSYQYRTVGDGCGSSSFDFQNYAYYVEARLSRTNSTGYPSLSILRMQDIDFC